MTLGEANDLTQERYFYLLREAQQVLMGVIHQKEGLGHVVSDTLVEIDHLLSRIADEVGEPDA